MERCFCEGCKNPVVYGVDWAGYKQYSCRIREHLYLASVNEFSDKAPDSISDYKDPDLEHPELLRKILREVYNQKMKAMPGVQTEIYEFMPPKTPAEI